MSLVNIAIWNINVAIWYYDKNISVGKFICAIFVNRYNSVTFIWF